MIEVSRHAKLRKSKEHGPRVAARGDEYNPSKLDEAEAQDNVKPEAKIRGL